MDVNEWVDEYKDYYPKYEKLTNKNRRLIEELLEAEGIKAMVEARTKSIDSFATKIKKKSYNKLITDVTDLSGIRIIAYSLDDVERIASIVNREFVIDLEKSINKAKVLDVDRFGYLSQHFVVKVRTDRSKLLEWADLTDLCAEIQVRTVLQHAWAAISHFLDYKQEIDIPKEIRRKLFRLSALFELADEELTALISEVGIISDQYKQQIQKQITKIEINVDSLRAYLENSNTVKYWANVIKGFGVGISGPGLISRDVEMLRMVGITDLTKVEEMLLSSKSWGTDYLKEHYENTCGGTPEKWSTDINGIITLFLIGNYPEVFTDEILDKQLGWGKPERATVPAKKYNPKFNKR